MGWYNPSPGPEGYEGKFNELCFFMIFFSTFFGILDWVFTFSTIFSWIFAISVPVSFIGCVVGVASPIGDEKTNNIKLKNVKDATSGIGLIGVIIGAFNTAAFPVILFSLFFSYI